MKVGRLSPASSLRSRSASTSGSGGSASLRVVCTTSPTDRHRYAVVPRGSQPGAGAHVSVPPAWAAPVTETLRASAPFETATAPVGPYPTVHGEPVSDATTRVK